MAFYRAPEIQAIFTDKIYGPDTVMRESICRVNGSNSYLYRSFLQHDLSALPPCAVIKSARLYLYCAYLDDSAATALHNFSRVTEAWDENTVTWNTMPAVDSRLYCGEDQLPPALDTWGSWDITPLVQEWADQTYPNYGLQVVGRSEGGFRKDWDFRNRRYFGGAYATYIDIEYETGYEIERATLLSIARAIREKKGKTDLFTPAQMAAEIAEPLRLQEKTVSPAAITRVVIPDEGYDGLGKVTVEALPEGQGTQTVYVLTGDCFRLAEIRGSANGNGTGKYGKYTYAYSSNTRATYVGESLMLTPGKTVTMEAIGAAGLTLDVSVWFLTQEAVDKVALGQDITGLYVNAGWLGNGASYVVPENTVCSWHCIRKTDNSALGTGDVAEFRLQME